MTNHSFYWIVGALVVGVLLGWWLGSVQSEEVVREEIRYVDLPPTTIYVDKPILVREEIIVRDTIREEVRVPIPTDTTAIVADYLKRREYDLDFSTDTTGTFKVSAIVEANRLASASATIQPILREVQITTREVRAFRPYIGGDVALGTKAGVSLEVGALLKDHHLPRVGYQRLGKDNYFTLGYGYTF